MRVIVTGSRRWTNGKAVYGALSASLADQESFVLVHGDCSTGADFYARMWAQAHPEVDEHRFPASWEAYGRAAGPMRNQTMVSAGADLVLAFPLPGGAGTQHTMRLAHEAGIPVRTYNPDGSVHATRWGWRLDGGTEHG